MPAIDQCDTAQGNMTALNSTLEIFDKFKSDEKDSDSEESFHLPLDDDDVESQSVMSNGRDKDLHSEDTEDDILNKFDTGSDHLDSKSDIALSIEPDDTSKRKSVKINKQNGETSEGDGDESTIQVKLTFDFGDYELTSNGEFRSFYEADQSPTKLKINDKVTHETEPNNDVESTKNGDSVDKMDIDENSTEENTVTKTQTESGDNLEGTTESKTEVLENHCSTDELLKQLDESINSPPKNPNEDDKNPSPLETKKDKSSEDKAEDDDTDLLDISMIRETEEDDACAIADAIDEGDTEMEEKETPSSEKSDEETNEKSEQEADSNDGEKDNDNEDNFDADQLSFDEHDDDSRMEIQVNDNDNSIGGLESQDNSNSTMMVETQKVTGESSDDGSCSKVDKGTDSNEDKVGGDGVDDCESTETVVFNETDNEPEETSKLPAVIPLPDVPSIREEGNTLSSNKRSLSLTDVSEEASVTSKKPKITESSDVAEAIKEDSEPETASTDSAEVPKHEEPVKTLAGFAKFMQCRKFTDKISRSDLEQFCIQKICESLILKSSEGELHQTIKKQEKIIDGLRKDLQQLIKQSKDLEIVNKKLMAELRNQSVQKKLLMPLRITRSVGLQVRMNPGNEVTGQVRRRQTIGTTSPPKQAPANTTPVNRSKPVAIQPSPVVRQLSQNSPQKSTSATPQTNNMLTQALQQNKRSVVAKRTSAVTRKPPETASTPAAPGVIDLTDEDEKLIASKIGTSIKIVNKTVSNNSNNKTVTKIDNNITPGKQLGIQSKAVVTANKTNLPQSIRLAPASVITSSANGSQMLYVVPTIASSSGGTQKVAFVNFQPTNGVLTGALNGSTMSVVPNKPGQTLTLKTVPSLVRNKHPAPLPPTPRVVSSHLKGLLPKPHLTIKKIDIGIILQWKMPYNLDLYENIASYQLYAYQETTAPPSTDMWRKVGDVKALALPMACTLTQFADKNKYYFAVRSVDVHRRIGAFSDPEEISL